MLMSSYYTLFRTPAKRRDEFLDARHALVKMLNDVHFGEANHAPAEAVERGVFATVFQFLATGEVRLAVVALNGNVSFFAENGEVEAITF